MVDFVSSCSARCVSAEVAPSRSTSGSGCSDGAAVKTDQGTAQRQEGPKKDLGGKRRPRGHFAGARGPHSGGAGSRKVLPAATLAPSGPTPPELKESEEVRRLEGEQTTRTRGGPPAAAPAKTKARKEGGGDDGDTQTDERGSALCVRGQVARDRCFARPCASVGSAASRCRQGDGGTRSARSRASAETPARR